MYRGTTVFYGNKATFCCWKTPRPENKEERVCLELGAPGYKSPSWRSSMVACSRPADRTGSWGLIPQTTSRKKRAHWDGRRLLKPQSLPWWHTSCHKATTPNLSQRVPHTGDKVFKHISIMGPLPFNHGTLCSHEGHTSEILVELDLEPLLWRKCRQLIRKSYVSPQGLADSSTSNTRMLLIVFLIGKWG